MSSCSTHAEHTQRAPRPANVLRTPTHQNKHYQPHKKTKTITDTRKQRLSHDYLMCQTRPRQMNKTSTPGRAASRWWEGNSHISGANSESTLAILTSQTWTWRPTLLSSQFGNQWRTWCAELTRRAWRMANISSAVFPVAHTMYLHIYTPPPQSTPTRLKKTHTHGTNPTAKSWIGRAAIGGTLSPQALLCPWAFWVSPGFSCVTGIFLKTSRCTTVCWGPQSNDFPGSKCPQCFK